MMRTSALVLSTLVPLAACDPAPPQCEAPPVMRAWNNALTLNGVQRIIILNGRGINGISLQGATLASADIDLGRVELRRGRLVALDAEGAVIADVDWVGTRLWALADGELLELEIEAVQQPDAPDAPTRVRLTFDGQPLCQDPSAFGMFVPGTWDETGAHSDAVAGESEFDVTYSCPSGVVAKCVTWGYAPWEVGPDVHQTCVRMARADYCGDGVSYTWDGTPIDLFDTLGIHAPTDDDTFEFEAGWGPDGAVCVSKPRYHETVVGQGEVLPPCWSELPACDDFEQAEQVGAVLANRSLPRSRLLCEPR